MYYGALDVSLSPLGEAEAKAAATYLQQFDLNFVVSSPLSRAVFGARQISDFQKNEVEIVKMEGFRELDRGSWCGLTKEEIGEETMARFDACDEDVTPEVSQHFCLLAIIFETTVVTPSSNLILYFLTELRVVNHSILLRNGCCKIGMQCCFDCRSEK